MKIITASLLVLLPFCVWAEDQAPLPLQQPDGVQIVDGKKFFPLNGARRQLSTTPSPSAIAVMNHPRADTRVSPAFRARLNPVTTANKPIATPEPASTDEAILSVFAPEDVRLKSIPLNSTSPYRK